MLPLTKAERTALFKSQNQAAATDAAKFAKETQKEQENLAKKKKQDTDRQGIDGRLVKLSRAMSQLLPHRAASEGVAMDCEGCVVGEHAGAQAVPRLHRRGRAACG